MDNRVSNWNRGGTLTRLRSREAQYARELLGDSLRQGLRCMIAPVFP
jgi:hypothetical protein